MRKYMSGGVLVLLLAAMLANPVMANERGHHIKQSNPAYWDPGLRQENGVGARQAMKTADVPRPSVAHATGQGVQAPANYQDVEVPH